MTRNRIILFFCIVFLCTCFHLSDSKLYIWGNSMRPTLIPGQIVEYQNNPHIEYEDIVVIKTDDKHLVKRIAGLPGDTISIENGILFRNEVKITENYALLDATNYGPITVPAGHLFVLGDNRAHSKDSRQIGCISIDSYRGTVILPK